MKLMCITDTWFAPLEGAHPKGPKYGDVVNSIDEVREFGYDLYELAEYPDEFFETQGFIPISDKDETEDVDRILDEMFVKAEKI